MLRNSVMLRLKNEYSYTSTPPLPSWQFIWWTFYFYLVKKFRDNSPTVTSYVIIITTEPIIHALIQQS